MRNKFKAASLLAAAGALAIAVPAAAHPGNTNHPSHPNHPTGTHSCKTHNVGYIVGGTVADASGLANGTLVITVTHANKWAKNDGATKGTSKTYTISGAKVKYDGRTTSIADGERVQLIGKFPMVRSHGKNECTPLTNPTPTFRMVVVHPAAS